MPLLLQLAPPPQLTKSTLRATPAQKREAVHWVNYVLSQTQVSHSGRSTPPLSRSANITTQLDLPPPTQAITSGQQATNNWSATHPPSMGQQATPFTNGVTKGDAHTGCSTGDPHSQQGVPLHQLPDFLHRIQYPTLDGQGEANHASFTPHDAFDGIILTVETSYSAPPGPQYNSWPFPARTLPSV